MAEPLILVLIEMPGNENLHELFEVNKCLPVIEIRGSEQFKNIIVSVLFVMLNFQKYDFLIKSRV